MSCRIISFSIMITSWLVIISAYPCSVSRCHWVRERLHADSDPVCIIQCGLRYLALLCDCKLPLPRSPGVVSTGNHSLRPILPHAAADFGLIYGYENFRLRSGEYASALRPVQGLAFGRFFGFLHSSIAVPLYVCLFISCACFSAFSNRRAMLHIRSVAGENEKITSENE